MSVLCLPLWCWPTAHVPQGSRMVAAIWPPLSPSPASSPGRWTDGLLESSYVNPVSFFFFLINNLIFNKQYILMVQKFKIHKRICNEKHFFYPVLIFKQFSLSCYNAFVPEFYLVWMAKSYPMLLKNLYQPNISIWAVFPIYPFLPFLNYLKFFCSYWQCQKVFHLVIQSEINFL